MRYYLSVSVNTPKREEYYWYDKYSDTWDTYEHLSALSKKQDVSISSYCLGVKSIKAFKRKVYKWKNQVPKGSTFILVSKYKGINNVTITV